MQEVSYGGSTGGRGPSDLLEAVVERGGAWWAGLAERVITCTPQRRCSGRARTDSWPRPTSRMTWTPWCWTLRDKSDISRSAAGSRLPACRAPPTFSLLFLESLPPSVDGRHLRLQGHVVLPDVLKLLLQEGDPLGAGHAVQLVWRDKDTSVRTRRTSKTMTQM